MKALICDYNLVHVPLSKNVIIYKVLRAVHDRLPTIWDEYPMPTRAILNNVSNFGLCYKWIIV
jgi:hypothetical protein